jgi:hypothetical protein
MIKHTFVDRVAVVLCWSVCEAEHFASCRTLLKIKKVVLWDMCWQRCE